MDFEDCIYGVDLTVTVYLFLMFISSVFSQKNPVWLFRHPKALLVSSTISLSCITKVQIVNTYFSSKKETGSISLPVLNLFTTLSFVQIQLIFLIRQYSRRDLKRQL